jgi:hypothetical protein
LFDALRDQPQTSDGDAVVRNAILALQQRLQLFATYHQPDPNPGALANDVTTTTCIGYPEYKAGKELW